MDKKGAPREPRTRPKAQSLRQLRHLLPGDAGQPTHASIEPGPNRPAGFLLRQARESVLEAPGFDITPQGFTQVGDRFLSSLAFAVCGNIGNTGCEAALLGIRDQFDREQRQLFSR